MYFSARMDTGSRTQLFFELIGTHFVDVYVNHLYKAAKKVATKNHETITAAYQRAASAYAVSIKSDRVAYQRTVQLVHSHVRNQTEIGVDFAGFVERVVGSLIPPKYHRSMNDTQKDEILADFLCNLISGLAVYSTTPDHLREIIDDRFDSERGGRAVRKMQDHALHLLNADQERLYNKFLGLDSQAKHGVSAELVSKMKGAIRQLALEKEQGAAQLRELENEKVKWQLKYKKAKAKNESLLQALENIRSRHTSAPVFATPTSSWPPAQVWPSATLPSLPSAALPPPSTALPPPSATLPPPSATLPPPSTAFVMPEAESTAGFSLASAVGPVDVEVDEESGDGDSSDSSGVDDEESGNFK